MKITIKANSRINNFKVSKSNIDGEIKEIVIDFEPSYPWSDLEFWLTNNEESTVFDYTKMNVNKRNRMKFSK